MLGIAGLFTSAVFARIVSWIITYTIMRIIVSMGFAVIVFAGTQLLWDEFRAQVESLLGALPVAMIDLLELSGMMFGINLMLSTIGAIVTIKGLTGWKKGVFR